MRAIQDVLSLTDLATPVLMKLSGHTSVRSLAKYVRVSDEGLLNSQADTDPAARRHRQRQRSGELSVAGRNMMSIETSTPLCEAAFHDLFQRSVRSDSWSGNFRRPKNSRLPCVPVK
jgi:hypothetical protein